MKKNISIEKTCADLEDIYQIKEDIKEDAGQAGCLLGSLGGAIGSIGTAGVLIYESLKTGNSEYGLQSIVLAPLLGLIGTVSGLATGSILGTTYSVAKNSMKYGPVKTYQALFKSEEKLQKEYQ